MLIPHSPASRKAGYGCTQRYAPGGAMHRIAGSSSASYMDPLTTMGVRPRTRTGLHGNRVGVTMPLEIALSPQARKTRFLPASTQDWASQADTRSFTGVPFGGFLGPPSETADLTRILRRRLAHISIAHLAAICNHFCIYTMLIIRGTGLRKNSREIAPGCPRYLLFPLGKAFSQGRQEAVPVQTGHCRHGLFRQLMDQFITGVQTQ